MADKVQAKPESGDNSIFHHGLIILLVMEELKKLNKDWSTFLFLSGYEVDVLTPRKTPRSKENTPRKDKEYRAEKEVEHEVEVKIEVQPMVEPLEVQIEQLQETMVLKKTSTSSKVKNDIRTHRRITISQIEGRGKLEDFLAEN